MRTKFQIIFITVLFLSTLFLGLNAASLSAPSTEEEVVNITSNVFPSVVKVEARNKVRKVATGVVIDKEGHIVTTALISPRDQDIFVTTSKGEKIDAEFLGMDSMTHLALIKAKSNKLTPILMGKAEDIFPGAWIGVVSISPENTPAITQGIISMVSKDTLRLNVWVVGTSGSPVVDKSGRMVGLLRGVYSDESPVLIEFREREVVGSGYLLSRAEAPSSGMAKAVPVDVVKYVASEIKAKGKVERGWLGVAITENEDGKVEISNVEDESPAGLADLKEGDIILQFDGKDVTGTLMLAYEIRSRKPKESVTIKIERKGKEKDVTVKLGEYSESDVQRELEIKFPRLFPPKAPIPPQPPKVVGPGLLSRSIENRRYIGVYLEELNKELAEFFGVKEGKGLLISKLSKDGPADKAGLKVGDVIIKAEGESVEKVQDLSEMIQDKKKGDKIKIEFIRDKKSKTVEVEIEEEEGGGLSFYSFPNIGRLYEESLSSYVDKISKESKKWQDETSKEYKEKAMKVLKEASELSKKAAEMAKKQSSEAKKLLKEAVKKYKGIRV